MIRMRIGVMVVVMPMSVVVPMMVMPVIMPVPMTVMVVVAGLVQTAGTGAEMITQVAILDIASGG